MPSPITIFTNALIDIRRLGAGDSAPEGEDAELCRTKFNRLLGQWNLEKRLALYVQNQAFTITTSAQSYALGTAANSANFVLAAGTSRPVEILRAKLVLVASSPDVEIELEVINVDQYANQGTPAQSATLPSRLYYQPTFPNGTVWLVPYPTTTTNQIRLYWSNQLVEVAVDAMYTNIDLAPGYEDALTLSLSEVLCLPFGKTISDDLKNAARKARANLKSLNNGKPPLMSTDFPTSPGRPLINSRTGNFNL